MHRKEIFIQKLKENNNQLVINFLSNMSYLKNSFEDEDLDFFMDFYSN